MGSGHHTDKRSLHAEVSESFNQLACQLLLLSGIGPGVLFAPIEDLERRRAVADLLRARGSSFLAHRGKRKLFPHIRKGFSGRRQGLNLTLQVGKLFVKIPGDCPGWLRVSLSIKLPRPRQGFILGARENVDRFEWFGVIRNRRLTTTFRPDVQLDR